MNNQQTREFVEQVATAFPGLLELLDKSPATLTVWARTLEQVAPREALGVLERWITGVLPDPPVGFRREMFALDVKSIVMRDRSDDARRKAGLEARTKADRNSYRPSAAFKSISEPFGRILELRKLVLAGELELGDCEKQIQQIIEEF